VGALWALGLWIGPIATKAPSEAFAFLIAEAESRQLIEEPTLEAAAPSRAASAKGSPRGRGRRGGGGVEGSRGNPASANDFGRGLGRGKG